MTDNIKPPRGEKTKESAPKGWLPIETAPKDGTPIRTWKRGYGSGVESRWTGDLHGWAGWAIVPTHWKPL